MAKKAVRKQAPPKPGERPQPSEVLGEVSAIEGEDQRSIEDLVADLGAVEEPPEPAKRKPRRKAKRPEAEAEGENETESETAVETGSDDASEPDSLELEPEATESELDGEQPAEPNADPDAEPVTATEPDDPRAVRLIDSLPIDIEDDLSQVEGEASPRLVSIVESLLFASSKPLRVKQIRRLLEEPSVRQIQLALKHLISTNAARGIVVAQVAGGFVLQTNPHNATWVQRLLQAKPVRLSRPQLETLAVIAYRQPVTRAEIDHVRGVDSGAVMKMLLERELIQIVGKTEQPGRPMAFGTTVGFLEFFNLMSLRDLPDLREFRELSDDTKATLRRRMGDNEAEMLGQEVLQFARVEEPGGAADGEPTEAETELDEGEAEPEPVANPDSLDDDAIAGLIAASEAADLADAATEPPEDDSPEDDSPEDDSPEDDSPEDDSAEDDSAEDDSAEDDSAEDDSPEDDSPEDDSPEDDSPEDDSPEEDDSPDASDEPNADDEPDAEDEPEDEPEAEDEPEDDEPEDDAEEQPTPIEAEPSADPDSSAEPEPT